MRHPLEQSTGSITPVALAVALSPSKLTIWGVKLLVVDAPNIEKAAKLSIPSIFLDGATGGAMFGYRCLEGHNQQESP